MCTLRGAEFEDLTHLFWVCTTTSSHWQKSNGFISKYCTALCSALLCPALLCSATVFQCSLASASFAEVQGGRSKMMRAALFCNICMSAIEVELPLSPHISQLLFLLKRQSLFNCFMQTYGLENQNNLICYRSVLQTRDKKWTWSNLSLDERHF